MSSEQEAVRQLLTILQEIHLAVQTLTRNQEKICQEQERAGKALGEAGMLLKHQGEAIIKLWRESGLPPIEDESAPPLTN